MGIPLKLVTKMKISAAIILATIRGTSAFCGSTAAFLPLTISESRTTVSLDASRAAQKKKSRAKWGEEYDAKHNPKTVEKAVGLMTNDEGLEYVKLTHAESGASSEIYLLGGVVTSYVDGGGQEYIAVRPDAKMDGSKPISGGLSHCWPQFGPGEIQQHGFARNEKWTVKSMTDATVELELAPSEYTKEMWDKEFLCTFSVSLEEDQLSTTMSVDNKGAEASFDFQAALHSYFTVSSLKNLEINGSFKGKDFLNKMVGDDGEMQKEERDSITITEEYDRVYKGVNDPSLKDSGTGKTLSVINSAGWEDTVLWNPFGSESMGYDNFVCVESVKFDPVTLGAGENWTGKMALKPTSN